MGNLALGTRAHKACSGPVSLGEYYNLCDSSALCTGKKNSLDFEDAIITKGKKKSLLCKEMLQNSNIRCMKSEVEVGNLKLLFFFLNS